MDAESYQRFRIGRDAIAERRTITPEADCPQYDEIFVRATTVEDKCAMHTPIGSYNKADPHLQIVVLNVQQRIRGEQGFRRTDISTFRQSQRLCDRGELGDMCGYTAQGLFCLRERLAMWTDEGWSWYCAPSDDTA
jgi:hypothetical protein